MDAANVNLDKVYAFIERMKHAQTEQAPNNPQWLASHLNACIDDLPHMSRKSINILHEMLESAYRLGQLRMTIKQSAEQEKRAAESAARAGYHPPSDLIGGFSL